VGSRGPAQSARGVAGVTTLDREGLTLEPQNLLQITKGLASLKEEQVPSSPRGGHTAAPWAGLRAVQGVVNKVDEIRNMPNKLGADMLYIIDAHHGGGR
jgi:hypothetical protein